jgi:uncharacterized membrane protein YraQ (UPF0718 family)
MLSFMEAFWELVMESAPWLLLGYFIAGLIKQVIPSIWIEKQLARPGLVSVVKGALIGAPLPLCSCGVIPTALAVRQAGASKGATASFLVATPETGVDSIAFSYAILGPVFAVARPIGALTSALVAGVFVNSLDSGQASEVVPEESGCCSSSAANSESNINKKSFLQRLISAIAYGYGRMIEDTAKWLLIGLVAAALMTTFIPESFFLQWGDGLGAMLLMVIAGLPMYICATASTPVAAGLLFAGVSPGAALVFMLTGPATNIATMGVIKEQLGSRSLMAYLLSVIGAAIACGLLLNAIYDAFEWPLQYMNVSHGETTPIWRQGLAVLLSCLVLRVWIRRLVVNEGNLVEA